MESQKIPDMKRELYRLENNRARYEKRTVIYVVFISVMAWFVMFFLGALLLKTLNFLTDRTAIELYCGLLAAAIVLFDYFRSKYKKSMRQKLDAEIDKLREQLGEDIETEN